MKNLAAPPQPRELSRTIAVDWSGAKSGERSKIWLAEVDQGRLVRLESGRDRDAITRHLIEVGTAAPDLAIGLDFAFSFPRWFLTELGAKSVDELWGLVEGNGEQWLVECEPPFWGRPGRRKPNLSEHFRATEAAAATRSQPKSVFQIGGAGAVGTASVRGMPHLAALRAAGFSIWPFHEGDGPLVIEIYPRVLTGAVVKSDWASRENYLAEGFAEIGGDLHRVATSSEDAFDAAVSAVVMWRHAQGIACLVPSDDPIERLEGVIWYPPARSGHEESYQT